MKVCVSNSSEEVFVIKIVKTLSRGYKLLVILMKKKLLEFTTMNCKKKKIKKSFDLKKVIKRKGDKLYVKWKEYDNSFKNWIDLKKQYK